MSDFVETVVLSRESYDAMRRDHERAKQIAGEWRARVEDAVLAAVGENPYSYSEQRAEWSAFNDRANRIAKTARVVVDKGAA